jgi:hypothetical protein
MRYHLSPSFYADAHHTMVGFHLDEAVYAPLYYGYGGPGEYADREMNARRTDTEIVEIAPDTALVLLKASPDALRERMKADPHENTLVKEKDIEKVLDMFEQQYGRSFIRIKFEIDNTDKTVDETLVAFVSQIQPHLLERDRLRILTRNLPQ